MSEMYRLQINNQYFLLDLSYLHVYLERIDVYAWEIFINELGGILIQRFIYNKFFFEILLEIMCV